MRINENLKNIFQSLVLLFFMNGCISTYRDFPSKKSNEPVIKKYEKLYYKISVFSQDVPTVISSEIEYIIRRIFMNKTPFKSTENSAKIPEKGYYCFVEVEGRYPSLSAIFFGTVSALTKTYLPAYSGMDGYYAKITLYKDAKVLNAYEYNATRKTFIWILAAPFFWMNYFTYDKDDVFEGILEQFFIDSKAQFEIQDKVETPVKR